MGHDAMGSKTVNEATAGSGLLVVAHWEAKEGQADRVADILSRFLPKALLIFVVDDAKVEAVVAAIVAAAHSGNESGDGLVWSTPIENVTHNRTGLRLEEVEVG